MVVPIGAIEAVARLKDNLSPQLKAIQGHVNKAGQQMSAAGDKMQSWGRKASIASALVVAGVAAAGVTFANFESSMNRVEAVSGATQAQMAQLSAQAKELGATTMFSASQAADGMGFLAQAGFEVTEVLSAMPDTLNLAAAGQLGLAEAADIASNVLSGFGFAASEMSKVADVMALTAANANTNIQMLGESFKYVGPVAAASGQNFEMIAAMLGKLGDAGIQASMAGTSLRGIISRLAKPGQEAADVFKRIGLEVTGASGKMRPLNDIMRDLGKASLSTADQVTIFGKNALAAGAVLTSVVDDTDELTEALRNAGGAAQRMADTQMKGLKGAFVTFKSASEGLLIALGEQLAPVLTWLIEKLTDLARWVTTKVIPAFEGLSPTVKTIVIAVGAFAAALGPLAIVGGTVLSMIGFMMTAITALAPVMAGVGVAAGVMWAAITGPVGLAVIAVTGLTAAWVLFGDKIQGAIDNVVGKIDSFLAPLNKLFGITAEGADNAGEAMKRASATTADLAGHNDMLLATLDNVASEEAAVAEETARLAAEQQAAAVAAQRLAEEAAAQAAAMAALRGHLLGLPTEEVRQEAELLRATWAAMNEDERTAATDRYTDSLVKLRDSGIKLTAAEMLILSDEIEGLAGQALLAVPPVELITERIAAIPAVAAPLPGLLERIGASLKTAFVDNFREAFSADKMASIVNGVLTGAMSLKDGLKSLGTQAADWLGTTMAAGLSAIPIAGPFLAKLGPALAAGIKSIGSKIGGWLGLGKDELDKMYDQFVEAGRVAWEKTDAFQRVYNDRAIKHWNENTRVVLASFVAQAEAAGVGYAEAKRHAMDYINAKKAGDAAAMESARQFYQQWAEASGSTAEEAKRHLADLEAAQAAAMDRMYQTTADAYFRAKDAGVAAYDETLAKALEAGLGQAEAAVQAAEAQKAAIAEVLAAEGEKHARQAAFEAALAEIRAGNAEGAIEAARRAAQETQLAWDTAMTAVQAADDATTKALKDGAAAGATAYTEASGKIKTAVENAATTVTTTLGGAATTTATTVSGAASTMGGAIESIGGAATTTATTVSDAASTMGDALGGVESSASAAAGAAGAIAGALNAIPEVIETTIAVSHHTTYSSSGSSSEVTPGETPGSDGPIGDDPLGSGGSTGPTFARGSGGIRDFGAGTRATLHGNEAVMTQEQIERLIASAASGGGKGDTIVIQVGNREVARYMLSELRDGAQGRGY